MDGPELTPAEAEHLARAAQIAEAGWGRVAPNPRVGCVLVRNGAVIAEGAHTEYGGPHAEIVALRRAGDATGATAFVSLEPCNHHGKTPPCVDALLEAGVSRVVFGAADPGGASGGGADRLRSAGVDVVGPVWNPARARAENPVFHHHSAGADRPFVAVKLALSREGAVARAAGEQTRITGPEAEADVHRLRSGYDAVMVGRGTLTADDPRLTVRRAPDGNRGLRRIILASDGVIPAEARLLEDIERVPVHLFHAPSADASALAAAKTRGVVSHEVDVVDGGLDLDAVLSVCHALGLRSILSEAGPTVTSSLLESGLVDRVILYRSPRSVPNGLPAFGAAETRRLETFAQYLPPATFGEDERIILDRREESDV